MPVRNLFQDIPASLPIELIETIAQSATLRIERIVSRGHASAPDAWYDQDTHEFVLLLQGQARLQYEQDKRILTLKMGDYLIIEAHQRHRVDWTDPERDTLWLAVHYK